MLQSSCTIVFATLLVGCFSFPQPGENSVRATLDELKTPLFRQDYPDEEDEPAETTPRPPSFGGQVAQIITGALTGDLSSILQGSFNLVPDPVVKNSLNGAWGTVAGFTTPPPSTTVAAASAAAITNGNNPGVNPVAGVTSPSGAISAVGSRVNEVSPTTTPPPPPGPPPSSPPPPEVVDPEEYEDESTTSTVSPDEATESATEVDQDEDDDDEDAYEEDNERYLYVISRSRVLPVS